MSDDAAAKNGSVFTSGPAASLGAPEQTPAAAEARPALPQLDLPCPAMELFDPEKHLPEKIRIHGGPSEADAPLPLAVAARANPKLPLVPRPEDCFALWQRYPMLEHIKAHSQKVADFALALTLAAQAKSGKVLAGTLAEVRPEAVLAAGLLHDLGKTYTICYGGNHAQLGASWVMRETGNAAIARAVMFHVHWPFAENFDDDRLFLVLAIIYADKRTKHDAYVSLDERFEDLVVRYAVNKDIEKRIELSHAQGKRIETALSRRLGVNLHEYTADSGRLVQRA